MLYGLIRIMFRLIFKILFRWRVTGHENIPLTGGVIIAPNHVSNIDPPLVGSAMQRRITIMAKEELFSSAFFGAIIKQLGAFPVKRGTGDRAAIKTALGLLNDGKALILFPEGTRSKTGELNKAQPGVAMMAIKSQVPVVPVAVSGTYNIFRSNNWLPPRFSVRFGKPIYPPEGVHNTKELMDEFSTKIMTQIATMLKEEKGQY